VTFASPAASRFFGLLAFAACAAFGVALRAAPQSTLDITADVEVVAVRPNLYLLAGAGSNIAVQVGDDGVVVVDAGSSGNAAAVVAAIKRITPQPIRYVIDTGPDADHVGGNEAVSKAGESLFGPARLGGQRQEFMAPVASILSVEGVLQRMSASSEASPAYPASAWPTETFHFARKAMYLNGEAIEVLHQPSAHTDSDAIVFFRRSDVVVAGDVIDARRFPIIDVDRGGSIQGEIAALDRLADLAVPSIPIVAREGGTIVVPGHGRLFDHYDVVEYRDMVTIVRDRVRDLVDAGRSLADVKAAKPADGYTGRYGNPDPFVEAIYRSFTSDHSSK
jgi:glyoxylase-like metal-dependent hydrolase (beta-lactamase superfamily II)